MENDRNPKQMSISDQNISESKKATTPRLKELRQNSMFNKRTSVCEAKRPYRIVLVQRGIHRCQEQKDPSKLPNITELKVRPDVRQFAKQIGQFVTLHKHLVMAAWCPVGPTIKKNVFFPSPHFNAFMSMSN